MSEPKVSEGLLRELAPQVLGALVRRHGQFDAAEDAVQEALLAAAVQWPREGIPANPRSWLISVATRRLVDEFRSDSARRRREDPSAVAPVLIDRVPSRAHPVACHILTSPRCQSFSISYVAGALGVQGGHRCFSSAVP